jgi:hypothetical protein
MENPADNGRFIALVEPVAHLFFQPCRSANAVFRCESDCFEGSIPRKASPDEGDKADHHIDGGNGGKR